MVSYFVMKNIHTLHLFYKLSTCYISHWPPRHFTSS